MMRVRAAVCLLLAPALGCATGVEPPEQQLSVDVGGSAGNGANAGDAGSLSGGGGAEGGTSAAGTAGGGVPSIAGAGASAGGSSSAGAGGNMAGGGGAGGNAGAGGGGAGGNAGAGGMPQAVKPSSISVGTTKNATTKQAPSAGGTGYDDSCPAGQVLVGFNGTVGSDHTYLRSVSGVCAALVVSAQSPYAVTTSQKGSLPVRMTAQPTAQSALCPANQVVVGFFGMSGGYIDSLQFKCAPLSVTGQAPNYALSIGNSTDTGGLGAPGGTAFNVIPCAAGQVAVSQRVSAGDAIDSFGIACSPLSLVVE